jgi:maltose alpha-D-glucosyltransferase/alpha-amylase
VGELPYLLTLPSHGFFWFRLATDVPVPGWHSERLAPEDLQVLVLFDGWSSFFRDRVVPWRIGMAEKLRTQVETQVLPRFVARERWYAAKGTAIRRVALTDHALLKRDEQSWLIALAQIESAAGEAARYFLPFALAWEEEEERLRTLAPATIAKVRQQAQVGALADATQDPEFCAALVEAIGTGTELPTAHGKLVFKPTRAFAQLAGRPESRKPLMRPPGSSSNTVMQLGRRLFLKTYRRVRTGLNPELEIGRYLTDVVGFKHCVPLAGSIEYVDANSVASSLALLQAYVENQGDGWTFTVDYVARRIEDRAADETFGDYVALAQTLARRVAELHLALAAGTDPAFAPEPATRDDLTAWVGNVGNEARVTLELLQRRRDELPAAAQADADIVLAAREALVAAIALPEGNAGAKSRQHGDLHLGQVLLRDNDWLIVDFEGEPARALDERRAKHSPLRDVAGMLRSFGYAAAAAVERVAADAVDREAPASHAHAWEEVARRAFADAYRETAGALYPPAAAALLRLFELEKACYELRYELDNRPSWAGIPLAGIKRMLALD